MPSDHIPDAKKMVELSRALTCAGVDTPVFRAIDGYWYDDDDGRNSVTIERVERELCYAAIVWLMGRGCDMGIGKMWTVWHNRRKNGVTVNSFGDTLPEALLVAVRRECADSRSDLEIDHD